MNDEREPIPVDEQDELVQRIVLFDLPQLDDAHIALIFAAASRLLTASAAIVLALVVVTSASASSGVIFSKRAARYETHRLLASSHVLSARCQLQTRRKLVCRFRFVHNGSTFSGDAILVPLTLHSYRQTTCVSGQCQTQTRKTADRSHVIVRA